MSIYFTIGVLTSILVVRLADHLGINGDMFLEECDPEFRQWSREHPDGYKNVASVVLVILGLLWPYTLYQIFIKYGDKFRF